MITSDLLRNAAELLRKASVYEHEFGGDVGSADDYDGTSHELLNLIPEPITLRLPNDFKVEYVGRDMFQQHVYLTSVKHIRLGEVTGKVAAIIFVLACTLNTLEEAKAKVDSITVE